MRHCFNILARKSTDILAWSITRSTRRLGGTPWKSWWGYAARSSKSGHYFRPKNVIFVTRFQTWPLKSIPVFRPGVSHKTQHTCLHRTEIMSSLVRLECQQKDFLTPLPSGSPGGLWLQDSGLTKAGVWGSEQIWQGSRAPGLQFYYYYYYNYPNSNPGESWVIYQSISLILWYSLSIEDCTFN